MALPPNRGGIPSSRPRIVSLPKAPVNGPVPRSGTPGEVYAVVQKAVADVVSKSLSPLHRQMGLILQQQRQLSVALGAIVQVLKAKGVLTQQEMEDAASKLVAAEMQKRAEQAKPAPGTTPPAAVAEASEVGRGDAHHDEHLNAGFHDPECVACLKIVDGAPAPEPVKAEEPKVGLPHTHADEGFVQGCPGCTEEYDRKAKAEAAHGVQTPPEEPPPKTGFTPTLVPPSEVEAPKGP